VATSVEVRDKPVFVFSSQGGQWPGMGQRLYAEEPVFREAIHACDGEIRRQLGWSLAEEFTKDKKDYRLHHLEGHIQPAVTALQIALSALFGEHGIEPVAVAGLSMGEVAATHLSGVIGLSDSIKVVSGQSKITEHKTRAGGMAYVGLGPGEVRTVARECSSAVSIAVELSRSLTVVSGEARALEGFLALLGKKGIRCGLVNVGFAFHGPEVSELRPGFVAQLQGLHLNPESVPVYSSVSGRRQAGQGFDSGYWWQVMSEPALFSTLVHSLLEDGYRTFVEFGPHPMLTQSILEEAHWIRKEVVVFPTMRRDRDERSVLDETLRSLGELTGQRGGR
jgi:acyl transferase domain-containing protein